MEAMSQQTDGCLMHVNITRVSPSKLPQLKITQFTKRDIFVTILNLHEILATQ
jgi:hypothetical protein